MHVSVLADMALRQETVAQRLVELRRRHALSQEDVARKVGIGYRQYQRWESGQSMPRPGNLGQVALAFGVPVSTFYNDEEELQIEADRLDRIEADLKQLLERQKLLLEAVTEVAEAVADLRRQDRPGQRRAS